MSNKKEKLDTKPWDNFPQNLKAILRFRGISAAEFILQTNKHRQEFCVSKIKFRESDVRRFNRIKLGETKPTIQDLWLFSRTLNIPVDELLFMNYKDFIHRYIRPKIKPILSDKF